MLCYLFFTMWTWTQELLIGSLLFHVHVNMEHGNVHVNMFRYIEIQHIGHNRKQIQHDSFLLGQIAKPTLEVLQYNYTL